MSALMRPLQARPNNTAPTIVRVANLPHFVDQNELARVFAPSPGLINARLLGGGIAHVSFVDPTSALNCKSLYHNWQGWGPALACEILPSEAGAGGGAKRGRDPDEPVYPNQFDPAEQYSKRTALSGGPGGPVQAFAGVPAVGSSLMPAQAAPAQQMPMSRALANPLASAAPANSLPSANPPDIMSQPAAMQSLPPASAQPQQALPASSAGLAAALANLNPAQLNSLAGLLNQAVQSSGAPQPTSLAVQQPVAQHALSGPTPVASQAVGNQQFTLQQQPGAVTSMPPAGQLYTPPAQPAPQQPLQLQQQPPQLAQFQQLLGGQLPQQAPQQQQQQQQPQQQAPAAMYGGVPQQQPAYAAQQQQQQQQQQQPPIILGMSSSAPMLGQPLQLLQPQQQAPPQQQPQQPLMAGGPQESYTVPPHLVAAAEPAGAVRAPPQAQERYPPHATPTLYLDGIPEDMTAREAAHIFRPVQGFQDLRLINKENPNRPGERSLKIFVDFVDVPTAAAAINLLTGYRLDLKDENSPVLRPVFGRPFRSERRPVGSPDSRSGPREPYSSRGGPPPRRPDAYAGSSRSGDPAAGYRRMGDRERGNERVPPPAAERDGRSSAGDDRRRSRW